MGKFYTAKAFWDFAKGKRVIAEDKAIEEFYGNSYRTYRDSVEHIFFNQEAYYDYNYYYDKEKDIIIESVFCVGD